MRLLAFHIGNQPALSVVVRFDGDASLPTQRRCRAVGGYQQLDIQSFTANINGNAVLTMFEAGNADAGTNFDARMFAQASP